MGEVQLQVSHIGAAITLIAASLVIIAGAVVFHVWVNWRKG